MIRIYLPYREQAKIIKENCLSEDGNARSLTLFYGLRIEKEKTQVH